MVIKSTLTTRAFAGQKSSIQKQPLKVHASGYLQHIFIPYKSACNYMLGKEIVPTDNIGTCMLLIHVNVKKINKDA